MVLISAFSERFTLYLSVDKFFELIWVAHVPPKVAFHDWRVDLNRLPTMDNLAKHGVLVDSNGFGLCYFCKRVPKARAVQVGFGPERQFGSGGTPQATPTAADYLRRRVYWVWFGYG